MSVDSIKAYTNKMYEQLILNKTERRIDELRLEERRIKQMREVSEQARIEMNRRMNRPGQNVDKLC
jgi:RNase P subunit RPR2